VFVVPEWTRNLLLERLGKVGPRPHADAPTFGMLIAFVIPMVIIFVGMGLRRFAGG
jgi:hypothetical protein